MKTKTKKVLIWTLKRIPFFTFMLVCSFLLPYIIGASTIAFVSFMRNPVPIYSIAEVNFARAEEQEMPMKLWILRTVHEAGLDINKVECLIKHESGFNDNAIGINKNSADLGVYQWNSQHIKSGLITIKCAGDYRCSTYKFIEKVKKDGNMNAWIGYTKNCK